MNKKTEGFTSYNKALAFLFANKHLQNRSRWQEMRTERMKFFLKQLGSPQDKLKVVHITGTAGKGSTSAMIANIACEAGYRVGLMTSPHLQTVRERILINNKKISEENFVRVMDRVKKAYDVVVQKGSYGAPDFQQIHVAATLWWFARKKVDVAVVEVGMGGYGDATNAVHPLIAIITNVGIDHVRSLGDTVEKVARVKAGIIKKNAIVITGVRQPKVEDIIARRAKHIGAKLITVKKAAEFKIGKVAPDFVVASIKTKYFDFKRIKIRLTGRYQVRNATIAVLTASVLRRRFGFKNISETSIREGLEDATIPGRFEIINKEPLVIMDSAHNEDKIKALVGLLIKLFSGKKLRVMMGFKKGKDYEVCLRNIARLHPAKLYLTDFTHRGIQSEDLKIVEPVAKEFYKDVELFTSEKQCLKKAMKETGEDEALIVTGSMYLVGSLRNRWDKLK